MTHTPNNQKTSKVEHTNRFWLTDEIRFFGAKIINASPPALITPSLKSHSVDNEAGKWEVPGDAVANW